MRRVTLFAAEANVAVCDGTREKEIPMKHSWTIRAQLLTLVLVAIAPLLLLVAFNILEHRERAREEALRDALFVARLISARVEDHLRSIDTLLTTAGVL